MIMAKMCHPKAYLKIFIPKWKTLGKEKLLKIEKPKEEKKNWAEKNGQGQNAKRKINSNLHTKDQLQLIKDKNQNFPKEIF